LSASTTAPTFAMKSSLLLDMLFLFARLVDAGAWPVLGAPPAASAVPASASMPVRRTLPEARHSGDRARPAAAKQKRPRVRAL
jgi:hypothetical protein